MSSNKKELALSAAKEKLSEIVKIDPKTLARSDFPKEINFEHVVPIFEEMIEACKQLNEREISQLTTTHLNHISETCRIFIEYSMKIQQFTIQQENPSQKRIDLIQNIENSFDNLMEQLLLPLAFTATQPTDYANMELEAKGYLETMNAESDKLFKYIQLTNTKVADALETIKDQMADVGVSSEALIFTEDAKQHEKYAKGWFWATVIMSGITFVATCVALGFAIVYHPENIAIGIQYVVAKLLVLSTLSFAVLWCARNYKTQKHNQTLNKHRANALMTFRAFVEGTSNPRVKDAILMQAAQAAFSNRPTGYDAPDKNPQTISPVVEIVSNTLKQSSDSAGTSS